jgi:large subunit ribosomal protein L25
MKLTATKRVSGRKGELKEIRRQGKIPAILYCQGKPNEQLTLETTEFAAVLRQMKQGHLPTTTFVLTLAGKEIKAIIKDIQYQLTTYRVSHIDFEELVPDVPVSVKVPIQCVGLDACVGLKLGGFLRQVIRHVQVECLPKSIPSEFVVDVRDLGLRQSKRLMDIPMPEGVKPLAKLDEVVVVIAKMAT